MKTKIKNSRESRARRKKANEARRRIKVAYIARRQVGMLDFGLPLIARGGLI